MRLAQETGKTSSAVETRPELDAVESGYWEAFQLLHGSRAHTGFGPGAIPLSEIVVYADVMELRGDARLDLIQVIRAMDRVYIEQVSKK